MLNFASEEVSIEVSRVTKLSYHLPYRKVTLSSQQIDFSSVITNSGDIVGVLQVERDNS